MATEVTIVMRFEHSWDVPAEADIEDAFDCVVVTMEEEEV